MEEVKVVGRRTGTHYTSMALCCCVCVGGDGEVRRVQCLAMIVRCDERCELPLVTVRCTLYGCSDRVENRGLEQIAEGGQDGSVL